MRRLALLLALAVAALAYAGPAAAEVVRAQDREGRTITFDVQAAGVDVEWYAELLRGALHGDEISSVTIRVVAPSALRRECGPGAAACYGATRTGAQMVVAAGRSAAVAATLLHEYAHHVDATHGVAGVPEPNGTSSWWASRGMAELSATGRVARDYSLGWDRGIGEIFAEDYVQVHMPSRYGIPWIGAPSQAVKDAIVADLGGTPPTVEPPAGTPPPTAEPETEPPTQPLVVVRSGRLAAGTRRALPFTLLGPGRRVEFVVRTTGPARMELVCDGTVVAAKAVAARRTASIVRANLGPAECEVALRSTGTRAARYLVGLRLSLSTT